ncbi:hypothetical protein AVM02_04425 [Brucella anthropi]
MHVYDHDAVKPGLQMTFDSGGEQKAIGFVIRGRCQKNLVKPRASTHAPGLPVSAMRSMPIVDVCPAWQMRFPNL